MKKEVLVLPGSDKEISNKVLVNRVRKKLNDGLDMKTEIVDLAWSKRKNLAQLEEGLDEKIKNINGQVVLVGISVGMTEAIIARHRCGIDKVSEIISVCGWGWPEIGLTRDEIEKLDKLKRANPVFGEAMEVYKEMFINSFQPSDWNRIMGFVATEDQIIPRNCSVINGMEKVVEVKGDHIGGILKAFEEVEVMGEFIRKQ